MLNKLVHRPILLSLMVTSLVANSVYGAKMVSSCHMDQTGKDIQGNNINIRYPIASVSKIFTSLLATTTFDLKTTFATQIFATPIGGGAFDVHIAGSQDPYFNKYKMHMIISRLNEAGVKKIRNLTFDEQVKYLHDTDTYAGFSVVTGSRQVKTRKGMQTVPTRTLIRPTVIKATLNYPPPALVEAELKEERVIMANYSASYLAAKAAGIELYKSPVYNPEKTSFLSARDFRPAGNTIKLYVSSQDVRTIIKSMNWNSNNHSANRLLVASGGIEKLNNFYFNSLKVSPSEFFFVNGSGQNHAGIEQQYDQYEKEGRLYNEASCSVVVRTLRALNGAVQKQGKQITDIMSVMGVDKGSTVGGAAYTRPETSGRIAAKTGTVGTNITLGGVINTSNGPHYFFYNVALKSASKSEENSARRMINAELVKLTKQLRSVPYTYSFDNPLKDNLDNYDEDEAPPEADDVVLKPVAARAADIAPVKVAAPAPAPVRRVAAPAVKVAAAPPAAKPWYSFLFN